jgi:hypothetical protein
MDEARKFSPAIMLTQMRQRVSRKGDAFLEGRLGLAKVLLLQSNKSDEDGNPIWNLCFQEIPREDIARPAASSPSIFAPPANVPPIAAKRKASPKRSEPAESEPYPFNDNIDDLFPAGRA